MGDPSGIGPEIVVKALAQLDGRHPCVVVGDVAVISAAAEQFVRGCQVRRIDRVEEAHFEPGIIDVLETSKLPQLPPVGEVGAGSGRAAFDAIAEAIALARAGRVAALVTAPIHKEALAAAGYAYPGHTEILADLGGAERVAMMLANDELRVVLTTIHCSLKDAIAAANPEAQRSAIRLAHEGARRFGIAAPRVAVAGLNPHAGEGGLFGREEIEIIRPAIEAARSEGIDASGPWSGDTVFMQARQGRFDVVVAQYHDQGLIPVKYLGVERGVNITLGLPFVRTSPDHGTAFDIAGQGIADPASLLCALEQAIALCPQALPRVLSDPDAKPDKTRTAAVATDRETALIGIDWGTTSFRSHRIGRDGSVLESRAAPAGILQVSDGDFEAVFERELGPWLERVPLDLPILASGMITSRQGWHETRYSQCPCDLVALARPLSELLTASGRRVRFVAGVTIRDADGVADVMRGEETQIMGCLDATDDREGLFVLPGTHSKWVLVQDRRITWFSTFMTGELFQALKDHTILGRLIEGDNPAPKAFEDGVDYGLLGDRASGGLLRRLFSVRTHGLFDEIPGEALADYLSGLLIGAEIREALGCARERLSIDQVVLVGGGPLVTRYRHALQRAGCAPRLADEAAAARGHHAIARAAGLLP